MQSFLNDYSCLIKLCFIVYIVFITLIAFYLLIFVPCIQLVMTLMKVLFVCECFRIQVYTCKCFTASRLGENEFYHYSQLTFKFKVCFRSFVMEQPKGEIVKMLFTTLCFVGLYSVPNLIVMLFNLLYLVFIVGFHCKGCV